jgi:RHS repeat-associated protein
MLPAAEERIPALGSGEEIFSLAAGVALAALETHQGAHAAQGKKPHQGIFSKKRTIASGATWAKYSGTHQDRKCSWSKTVSGSALDANGNTLSDPSGKSYSWDFENRLVQAVVPGTGTVSFKYDPFGHRIQKSGPLGTTNYLYDGMNLLEELGTSGNVLARYASNQMVDQPLAMLRGGATSYYQADVLGSTTSLSSSAGALANTYTYDAFGNLTASTGTLVNPFQYTGRESEPETGIYYYRARYYDTVAARFVSEDPVRFDAGVNFYSYVRENPINQNDPLGLAPCDAQQNAQCTAQCAATGQVVDTCTSWTLNLQPYFGAYSVSRCKCKSPFGKCTPLRQATLQYAVDAACKSGQPSACNAGQSCGQLEANWATNTACGAARTCINNECYGGGDSGHRTAAANAMAAANKCLFYMMIKGCR